MKKSAMKRKLYSIYDISKELQLSPATISRVLNHPEQVQKKTRDRVLVYMQKIGFEKRMYALMEKKDQSTLASSPYSAVYLVSIPSASNPFYADILEGMMTAAAQYHCHIYVDYTVVTEQNIHSFLSRIAPYRGLISLQPLTERTLHQITAQIPVVQCSEQAPKYPEVSTVTIDNVQAEKKAAEYLISLGCKRFSFFTTMTDYHFAEERLQGLRLALEDATLSLSTEDIVRVSSMEYQSAYDSALFYLKRTRPDAIVCISDVFAAACINAAHALSIRVPEDLMVIGFDNISVSLTSSPSITTISQPRFQLGFHAFEVLYREAHEQGSKKTHMVLATDLVIRGSTAGSI